MSLSVSRGDPRTQRRREGEEEPLSAATRALHSNTSFSQARRKEKDVWRTRSKLATREVSPSACLPSFSFPFFSVTDESVLHRGQAPHATCVGKSLSLRTKALHDKALVAHSHPSALMRPRVYESAGA